MKKIAIRKEELRDDQFFSRDNRGRTTIRSQKWMPLHSDEFGICEIKEFKHYFSSLQGSHNPGKNYFEFMFERDPVVTSLKEKYPVECHGEKSEYVQWLPSESKYDEKLSYAKQVAKYNIPFISGPSGTVTVILPVLETLMPDFNEEQRRCYVMALSGVETAFGHHSMYEVAAVASRAKYDATFYTKQLLTPAFIKSKAYRIFQREFQIEFDKMALKILPRSSQKNTEQELEDIRSLPKPRRSFFSAVTKKVVIPEEKLVEITKDYLYKITNKHIKVIAHTSDPDSIYKMLSLWAALALKYQKQKEKKSIIKKAVGRFFSKGLISYYDAKALSDAVTRLVTKIMNRKVELRVILEDLASLQSVDGSESNTVLFLLNNLFRVTTQRLSELEKMKP